MFPSLTHDKSPRQVLILFVTECIICLYNMHGDSKGTASASLVRILLDGVYSTA